MRQATCCDENCTLQHHDQRRRQPYFNWCELQVALEYDQPNMFPRAGRLLINLAIGKTFRSANVSS